MKRCLLAVVVLGIMLVAPQRSLGYPSSPAHAGRSCLECHKASGPWQGNGLLLTDILDARSERSYRTGDNEFVLSFAPGEEKALVGLFGVRGIAETFPRLAGWAVLDDGLVKSASLAAPKFPAGWEINRPYGFSYLGDKHELYPGAQLARVPFAMRAGPQAREAVVSLHVLVQGERDTSGAQTAYEKATVRLVVTQPQVAQPAQAAAAASAPTARTPGQVARLGMEVFREKKCGACHQLGGVGGTTGPDLTHLGANRSREWLEQYLRNPKSIFPDSYVRPIEMSEEKLAILLDFLQSLR